jgi:3-oxosteroid 1-dehydrogenase
MMSAANEYDVVVAGTGGSGLCAALTASVLGSRVLIVEKAAVIGGTTALSGGGAWVPGSKYASQLGATDSRDDVLTYIRAVSPEGWHNAEDARWVAFVDHAPLMLEFLEAHSPLVFGPNRDPDPYVEAPGGKAFGRMVSPRPLSKSILGSWKKLLRGPVYVPGLNYEELVETSLNVMPLRWLARFAPRMIARLATGKTTLGNALVVGLLKGCLRAGCDIWTESPLTHLEQRDGRITAVHVQRNNETQRLGVKKGVVLACGGFEWNEELMAKHFPGDFGWRGSPQTNTGDGHRLAVEVGAKLDRMDQALIYGTTPKRYEGVVRGVPASDYTLPHSMIVNARAERFMNEKQMNIGLAFDERDATTGAPVNLPAWRIYDAQFRKKYRHMLPKSGLGATRFEDRTLDGLATQIGLQPVALVEAAKRFSEFSRRGIDEDFGRGTSYWDRNRLGDPRQLPNPTLGSIEVPPFYAYPFKPSLLGTKGGPRTNERGQVTDENDEVIGGLYAAGNLMANPFGSKGVGAGSTIGPVLTWGHICGLNVHAEQD